MDFWMDREQAQNDPHDPDNPVLRHISRTDVWQMPGEVQAERGIHLAEVTFDSLADTDEVLGINPTVRFFRKRTWWQEREEVTLTDEDRDKVFFEETGLGKAYFPDLYVEQCHHGLSAWLCADPINHYPPDNQNRF